MKKIFTFILLFMFYQVALPQSSGFWMGDFIGSSESSNFRVLVNNSIYQINDTTWTKDIPISPPNLQYVSADIDSNNNIWLFANKSINIWNRKNQRWLTFTLPPIWFYEGKVFGKYVYCANSTSIYRANYTQPTITWKKVYSDSSKFIDDFYVHGKDIYVAIYSYKVFKAEIGTQNWVTILTTPSSPGTVVVTDSMIVVGTYWNGVYTSVNNGKTWYNGKGFPERRGAETIKINKENELYVLQKDQIYNTGWYYSSDRGKTFVKLNFNLSPWSIFQMRGIQFSDNNIYINVGYGGFLKSNNHGKTWVFVNNGYNDYKPHHIKRILSTSDNEIIALSSEGGNPTPGYTGSWGIFSSTNNGASWKEVSQKLQTPYMIIEDIVENEAGDLIVAPYAGEYILKKNAKEWVKINVTGVGSTINELERGEGDTLFAGTYSNGILRSSDGGYSWKALDVGVSLSNHPRIYDIFTKKQDVFTIVGGFGIYYSQNSGDTWQKINDDGIQFIGVRSYKNLLFGYTTSKIYKYENEDRTWIDITGNLPNTIEIRDIDIEGENIGTKENSDPVDGTIFIASNIGVFQKTKNMTSWVKISSTETNCISYSKTLKEMLFGGVTNIIKEDYNASSVITFEANSQMILFNVFFSSQTKTIEVENKSKTDHIKSVSLYNTSGQELLSKDGLDNCSFNINGFPSGFFLIHVIYKGGRAYTKKLLITK